MVQRKHSVELKLLNGVEDREFVSTVKAADREPKPPTTLQPAERKVWNHVVRELRDMDLLAAADLYEIVSYCQAVVLAELLHVELMKGTLLVTNPTNGVVHPNPLIANYNHVLARTHALAKALGLNPYARTLIYGRATEKADNEASHTPDLYTA